MNTPRRIQRKRTKGFSLKDVCKNPNGYVVVSRPTKWGNPYKPGEFDAGFGRVLSLQDCIACYELLVNSGEFGDVRELRGKDLSCFCSLDQPCHADVLLRLANS